MLTALLIMAFVYPVVYLIRRFILKEPKYTGDVDGDQDTRPIVLLAVGVTAGMATLVFALLFLLGVRGQALTISTAGTILIAYHFMRK